MIMTKNQRKEFNKNLFSKVLCFIEYFYPGIYENAKEEYVKQNEDKFKAIKNKQNFQEDYNAWFLVKLVLPNRVSVIKMALSFPEDYFTKEEKKMLKNLLNYKESVFEILNISKDNKNYEIKDFVDGKIYKIKTFNLPVKYNKGDIITAFIVKDVEDNYFFLGAISSYDIKNKENFVSALLLKFEIEGIEREKRDECYVEWEIEK
jgi:hypothetical protein